MRNITNNFKKNYFIINMIDLEKSFKEYLEDAEFNYVIIYRNVVDVWGGTKNPVIYGDVKEVYEEVWDVHSDRIKRNYQVMTEQEFLLEFCMDAIKAYLYNKIRNITYFDGVNYILHFDNTFNNVINIDGIMIDILNVCIDEYKKELSFLISDENDDKQCFCGIEDFPSDVIIKIINYIEKENKPTITPKGFITDLYDLLVRNTHYITEEQFFKKYIENDETICVDTTENGEYYKIEFEKFNLVVVPKN